MAKILVALSGGVDSSVAALLLKQAGHDVSSAYIRTWLNEETPLADCPAQEDIKDSRAIAKHLKIDYEILNLVNEYRNKVVNYLIDGYKKGFTPNPDTMCNKEMKFGIFLKYAISQGFDSIATGHYVRKIKNKDGTYDILQGLDENKDQSYFLSLLNQKQIQKSEFPLGDLTKKEVREIAKTNNLLNSGKKDSQGICFLGNMNINRFLEHYIEDNPGLIINNEGKVLGEHKGLHRFTIGQRKGIGVPSNSDYNAYVVTNLDFKNNILNVAFDNEKAPLLYSKRVEIENINFTNHPILNTKKIHAKPRYRDPSQLAIFNKIDVNNARVDFDKKQRALALGQILSFYEGEKLIGGGYYSKIYPTINH